MFKRAYKSDYIAFNIELVKAVEKHPCIYDYNLKEYCNRDYVHRTWEKIAQKFNSSAKECKDTWKNLRIVYSRNLKKQTPVTGSRQKPYYLLEIMSFLKPFMKFDGSSHKQYKPINETIYYETTSDEQISNRDEEEDNTNKKSDTNISNLEITTIKEEYDSDAEIFSDSSPKKKQYEPLKPVENQNKFPRPITIRKNSETALIDSSITSLDNFPEVSFTNNTTKGNTRHQFLMSLFSDVDDMDDTQFRLFRLEVCKLVSNIFTFQPPTAHPMNRTSI